MAIADRRGPAATHRGHPVRTKHGLPAFPAQGAQAGDVQGDRVPGRRLGGYEGVRGQEVTGAMEDYTAPGLGRGPLHVHRVTQVFLIRASDGSAVPVEDRSNVPSV